MRWLLKLWCVFPFAFCNSPFKVLHGRLGLRYRISAMQLDLLNLPVDTQLGEVSPVAERQAADAPLETVLTLL